MDIENESYWAIGEAIKSKRKDIQELKKEVQVINDLLLKQNSTFSYNLELKDSVCKLNEIAAKQYKIRYLEEDVFQCEFKRKRILNNSIYKLRIRINSFDGNIEFFLNTKGKESEILFMFNGNKLIKAYPKLIVSESSWVKYGKKAIQKSILKIFDKKYVLHSNGDFVVILNTCNDDYYKPEDVVGNVINFDLISFRL